MEKSVERKKIDGALIATIIILIIGVILFLVLFLALKKDIKDVLFTSAIILICLTMLMVLVAFGLFKKRDAQARPVNKIDFIYYGINIVIGIMTMIIAILI